MAGIRLYSGPAYQPINEFLRTIGKLSGLHREAYAQHPSLTFAATVGHICRAIRKLAAVARPDEMGGALYRGVRGELPRYASRARLPAAPPPPASLRGTVPSHRPHFFPHSPS